MRLLQGADVKNKKVFLRADLNVSVDKKTGRVASDFRIKAVLPTIQHLVQQGAKVILASHFGRPDGKRDKKYSLKLLVEPLGQLLGQSVKFVDDCVGDKATAEAARLKNGEVLLLENLRFYPEEERNDSGFAKLLADLADVYINDAFGVCHRAHASVQAVTKYLPSYAGLLIQKEVEYLDKARQNPEHPFILLVGGAKISDKLESLVNLGKLADKCLIGGALANTFLAANGVAIGASLYEREEKDTALKLMEDCCGRVVLPFDGVACKKAGDSWDLKAVRETDFTDIQNDEAILDIGSKTIKKYAAILKSAKTIFWAGPMGLFEIPEFAKGTLGVIKAMVSSKALSVAGGGETVTILEQSGYLDKFSHVSTGGSASLEYVSGNPMPGLEALN
ncbi:MAG: phosphoglycerate kinase [Parcubacteria group bacterium]|nr:phosphoglycerate kinase [Parcubacteria group bacterium]